MMRAAIARLRDSCGTADLVLADALAALERQPPDNVALRAHLDTARRILRAGVASSRMGGGDAPSLQPPPPSPGRHP